MCFFLAALCETFCVHHPRICWRAGCSQHHTTDMSLNITIDFINHQSPKTNIDNADTTTVTSTFLQSNSSPLPGRFWKMIWFFVHFWRATFLQHTPTYHQQREESCWPISCCSSINFLQYLGLTRWQRYTKIFILAEMFAVQKHKAGALTFETSIFQQYPKIYVYLILFDCDYVTMYLIIIILLGASAQDTAREYKRQKHTHTQSAGICSTSWPSWNVGPWMFSSFWSDQLHLFQGLHEGSSSFQAFDRRSGRKFTASRSPFLNWNSKCLVALGKKWELHISCVSRTT